MGTVISSLVNGRQIRRRIDDCESNLGRLLFDDVIYILKVMGEFLDIDFGEAGFVQHGSCQFLAPHRAEPGAFIRQGIPCKFISAIRAIIRNRYIRS